MIVSMLALVGLVGAGLAVDPREAPTASGGQVVWQWFAPCPQDRVVDVEVRFQGTRIYSMSYPACSMSFNEIPVESPQKVLAFKFRARASRFGREFHALGVPLVEGNIWRAGGERDGIMLGVSCAAGNRILLNGLHRATAGRRSSTELADGFAITTSSVHTATSQSAR
jgi:hypothetical protein